MNVVLRISIQKTNNRPSGRVVYIDTLHFNIHRTITYTFIESVRELPVITFLIENIKSKGVTFTILATGRALVCITDLISGSVNGCGRNHGSDGFSKRWWWWCR